MTFISFLVDNLDSPGRVHRFANIVSQDIDNGCGSHRFDAIAWKLHFEDKHAESANRLKDMLLVAYTEYVLTIKTK